MEVQLNVDEFMSNTHCPWRLIYFSTLERSICLFFFSHESFAICSKVSDVIYTTSQIVGSTEARSHSFRWIMIDRRGFIVALLQLLNLMVIGLQIHRIFIKKLFVCRTGNFEWTTGSERNRKSKHVERLFDPNLITNEWYSAHQTLDFSHISLCFSLKKTLLAASAAATGNRVDETWETEAQQWRYWPENPNILLKDCINAVQNHHMSSYPLPRYI